MLLKNIKEILAFKGLDISFLTDEPDVWENVLNRAEYVPISHTIFSIDFQLAYQLGHGGLWQDISVIIYWDLKPVAVWPLSLSMKNSVPSVSSQGLPVHPPLFIDSCANSSRKRIVKLCLDTLDNLARELRVSCWDSAETYNQSTGFSEWHLESMLRGASCKIEHDLFIDLRKSLDEIRGGFRKSYRSLIASGSKNWSVEILDTENQQIWNSFKNLHLKISGRKTRSDETWDIHLDNIKQQQGFLIYLLNASGEMDGAGFFNFSQNEGLYAVAAYDRNLFDKPLGHIVQYRAIQELKKRGIVWYKLGHRPYQTDQPTPTDKEVSIAEFKEGFASNIFPRFILNHKYSGSY